MHVKIIIGSVKYNNRYIKGATRIAEKVLPGREDEEKQPKQKTLPRQGKEVRLCIVLKIKTNFKIQKRQTSTILLQTAT